MFQDTLKGSVTINQEEPLKGAVVKAQEETLKGSVETRASFYFDIIQDHSISLQSQITDNWMENNTAIADHITNSPIVVNLKGLSGELVYVPSTSEGWLNSLYDNINFRKLNNTAFKTDKLTVIPQLLPPVDNVTQLAKNAITYIEASANRYKTIFENFKNLKNPEQRESRLEQIYSDLHILWELKSALTIETPFKTFEDMYIQSLTLRQGEEGYITDIELTLKQAYFTETQTTEADKAVLDQMNELQRADVEDHGKVQGKNVSIIKSGINKMFPQLEGVANIYAPK